ncbi:cellulase family glycosylhydrolase [Rhodocytophaga aerolata]|uniref:Cellulase family glycosylhydrolase n=1 Tax=Rhodocytophaga aerolata TaxID=455078 RepID=A0ABT8R7I6_9BACT|nr:endo-1,4-beta-xylanase [Rhodocytophaga aerolata]MDO1448064.1 cellulase family glycosylhydrolase [Rhodocytophaga aerolata]
MTHYLKTTNKLSHFLVILLYLLISSSYLFAQNAIWTKEKANSWYKNQPWLVGSNYAPNTAINQLEMWQADTFDPEMIDEELGWAEGLGFNTMRVFLHDKLWEQDAEGFKKRIDQFLTICAKHKIRPMFVLFDSVWNPESKLGKQPEPKPGVHNSGWVQNPGAAILQDPKQYPKLEAYVKGIVGHFANDKRILAWDVWNEPDNDNGGKFKEPANKVALVEGLLPKVFTWTRAANPSQPITCGIWKGDWSTHDKLTAVEKIQIDNSDIISFHNYDDPADLEKRIQWLQRYGRPMLCTEYMARGNKSTFQGSLPVLKKYKVAAYNWGFVAGKSNTIYAWDTWKKAADGEPALWFHDIFRTSGQPYRREEVAFIKQMTGVQKNAPKEAEMVR